MIPKQYLPPIFFMLVFCVSLSLNDANVKLLSNAGFSIFFLMFIRTVFILTIGSPILFLDRFKNDWRQSFEEWPRMLIRGLLLFLPAILWLSLLKHVPLAQLFAVGSFSPILQTILSGLVLKERIGKNKIIALLLGCVGTLVVIQPTLSDFNPYLLGGLVTSLFWAIGMVMTKPLSSRYSPLFLSYHLGLVFLPLTAGMSIITYHPVSFAQLATLFGMAILVFGGYWGLSKAFRGAPLSLIALFEYSAVIFSAIFGFLLFKEIPTLWTWVGSLMIVGGSVIAVLSEKQAKKPSIS